MKLLMQDVVGLHHHENDKIPQQFVADQPDLQPFPYLSNAISRCFANKITATWD